MPIMHALLYGSLACCLAASVTGQGTTESAAATTEGAATNETGDASPEDWQTVMEVLRPGLPCCVKDLSKYNDSIPCVECAMDLSRTDTDLANTEGGGGRRKRHAWSYPYFWSVTENKQRYRCPRTDQPNVTQGLSTDPTDYPLDDIAGAIIVGRMFADPSTTLPLPILLASACIPGQAPVVHTGQSLAERACPTNLTRLFRYNSSTYDTPCWLIQNLDPPVYVSLECRQNYCTNCWSVYGGYYNLCYPEFQVFNVRSYCPALFLPLVFDTILVPVGCTCRTVRCWRRKWWWG